MVYFVLAALFSLVIFVLMGLSLLGASDCILDAFGGPLFTFHSVLNRRERMEAYSRNSNMGKDMQP